jgi:hypothetical protein
MRNSKQLANLTSGGMQQPRDGARMQRACVSFTST